MLQRQMGLKGLLGMGDCKRLATRHAAEVRFVTSHMVIEDR